MRKGEKARDRANEKLWFIVAPHVSAYICVICAEIISELDHAKRRDFVIREKLKLARPPATLVTFLISGRFLKLSNRLVQQQKAIKRLGQFCHRRVFSLHSFTFTSCARLTHIMLLAQMRKRINCQQQRVVCREKIWKRRKGTTTTKKKRRSVATITSSSKPAHNRKRRSVFHESCVLFCVYFSSLSRCAAIVRHFFRRCRQRPSRVYTERLPTSSRFHLMMINFSLLFGFALSAPSGPSLCHAALQLINEMRRERKLCVWLTPIVAGRPLCNLHTLYFFISECFAFTKSSSLFTYIFFSLLSVFEKWRKMVNLQSSLALCVETISVSSRLHFCPQ